MIKISPEDKFVKTTKINMDLHDIQMFLDFVLLLYKALGEISNTEGS